MERQLSTFLKDSVQTLGITLNAEQLARFSCYFDLLHFWNPKINLFAPIAPKELLIKHFLDSLAPIRYYDMSDKTIIDIGSGAGFPAIPLAIAANAAHITMLESARKKASFLREAATALSLANVNIINERVEASPEKYDLARPNLASCFVFPNGAHQQAGRVTHNTANVSLCAAGAANCDIGAPFYSFDAPNVTAGAANCDIGAPFCSFDAPNVTAGAANCDIGAPFCSFDAPNVTAGAAGARSCHQPHEKHHKEEHHEENWGKLDGEHFNNQHAGGKTRRQTCTGYEIVISRAALQLPQLCAIAARLLTPNGVLLAMRGSKLEATSGAKNAQKEPFSMLLLNQYHYHLVAGNYARRLLVFGLQTQPPS